MRTANLGLRFLLELAMLAAVAFWGFRAGPSLPLKLLLGLGGPLLFAAVWGVFISPKARYPLSRTSRLALELLLFAIAALLLVIAGRSLLAVLFGGLVLVSSSIHFLTEPRNPPH